MTKTMTDTESVPSHVQEGVGGSFNKKEALMKALRVFIIASMLVVLMGQYMIHQRLLEAYSEIDQLRVEASSLRLHLETKERWKEIP